MDWENGKTAARPDLNFDHAPQMVYTPIALRDTCDYVRLRLLGGISRWRSPACALVVVHTELQSETSSHSDCRVINMTKLKC